MASLATKSLSEIVKSWTVAAQAAATQVLDFSIGSVNLALAQAGGSLGLWLQKLALQVLAQTRFATSTGADADSWGAQFGFTRLAAVAATGTVTFGRADSSIAATVLVGTTLQTSDGTQSFTVTASTSNALYNSASNAYVIPSGTASADLPVQAATAGTAGNVISGTITVLTTGIAGIDTVTNNAALLNGLAAESDSAYKARFPLYLAGLAKANRAAIASAIAGVQQGIQYIVVENQNVFGSPFALDSNRSYTDIPGPFAYPTLFPWPGMFFAVIDDGSGSPPASLLSSVSAAINAVRGFAIEYQVFAPAVMPVDASFTMTVLSGYDHGTLAAAAITAVQNYLNGLPLGTALVPLSRIAQVVYDGVTGIANVIDGTIMLNGADADLTFNIVQRPRAGTITVN